MTEHEWLTCRTAPMAMFRYSERKTSPRKLRLLAAACCQLVRGHIAYPGLLAALERLELYVDGVLAQEGYDPFPVTPGQTEYRLPSWDDLLYMDPPEVCASTAAIATVSGATGSTERCVEWVLEASSYAAPERQRRAAIDRTRAQICDLFREIVGNPFRPWASVPDFLGGGVVQPDGKTVRPSATARDLAASIHADQAFDRLPVLADALEESGVTDPDILTHCRDDTGHVRGCWALDVVRGKA